MEAKTWGSVRGKQSEYCVKDITVKSPRKKLYWIHFPQTTYQYTDILNAFLSLSQVILNNNKKGCFFSFVLFFLPVDEHGLLLVCLTLADGDFLTYHTVRIIRA